MHSDHEALVLINAVSLAFNSHFVSIDYNFISIGVARATVQMNGNVGVNLRKANVKLTTFELLVAVRDFIIASIVSLILAVPTQI